MCGGEGMCIPKREAKGPEEKSGLSRELWVVVCGQSERCRARMWVDRQGQRAQGARTPHQEYGHCCLGVMTRNPRGLNHGGDTR